MTVIQSAIQTGMSAQLLEACQTFSHLVNEPFPWGPDNQNRALPLAWLCDRVFEGHLSEVRALELFHILIEHGASVNPEQIPGKDTPLISACSLYTDEIALQMLDLGANIRPKGTHGGTALHWAAWTGADRVVQRLIQLGADIHQDDNEFGATPLFWAAHGAIQQNVRNRRNQIACMRHLRDAGADPEARSADGIPAIDMVSQNDFPELWAELAG